MRKITIVLVSLLCGFVLNLNAQPGINGTKTGSQIEFLGIVSQGEGTAGWYADGTGPEAAGIGHMVPGPGFTNIYYYGASHDYITNNPNHSAFHFMAGMTGFPEFGQALNNSGYVISQVRVKFGLNSVKDDIEGEDWFTIDNFHYANFYDCYFTIELNGEPMLSGFFNYTNTFVDTTGSNFIFRSSYSPLSNISSNSSAGVQAVAQAFLNDLAGREIKITFENTPGSAFSGNGRTGAYYNIINGVLEVGNPEIPWTGMVADHEGFAGWDADGTGPEPLGDGHGNHYYYGASLDYDDIDPDSTAALGHFITGATGFINTLLQLDYRGFEIGDLRLKMGLTSLGLDVQGEDWNETAFSSWSNSYNTVGTIELSGEPILYVLLDTNTTKFSQSVGHFWSEVTSSAIYDISQNASVDAQSVAKSFIRDLGNHYVSISTNKITTAAGGTFNSNGRNGSLFNVDEGILRAICRKATFIPAGEVAGTWTLDGSPYYVDGHITIEDGQTLTIEPGVMVGVRGPWHFSVQGRVLAEGTKNDTILFTRSNPNVMWDGFDYYETPATNDSSKFDYCIFEHGYGFGGSIFPTSSGFNGGGIFALKFVDKLKIRNSVFRYNLCDKMSYYPPSGGAIAMWNSDPFIQKCKFNRNSAMYGGALFAYKYSNPVISNCLFYDNQANNGGALCFYDNANGVVINNTIADNSANFGGALYFYYYSNPEIINTLIWGNTAQTDGDQIYFSTPSSPGFYYCDIEGGQLGFSGTAFSGDYLNNIEDDPLFWGDSVPYRIIGGSPCIEAGTPDTSALYYLPYLPYRCFNECDRILDQKIDIGAYEQSILEIDEQVKPAQSIIAYPNPFTSSIHINFEIIEKSDVSIQIYNNLGQMVDVLEKGKMQPGQYNTIWNAETQPQGIYFLRLQSEKEILATKIIKQ